ncbi:MAG: hypothetical protein WCJ58_04085 [bacterium]
MKKFFKFAPFAVSITCIFGVIYGVVQQVYRQSANDPQIQMAEDAAKAIADGEAPINQIAGEQVDLSSSLAPFIIIYDNQRKPITSNVFLSSEIPIPPAGSFEATIKNPGFLQSRTLVNNENRFTWAPEKNVRVAAVLIPIMQGKVGYVLAGRSLREVEAREQQLQKMVIIGWVMTMGVTFEVLSLSLDKKKISNKKLR